MFWNDFYEILQNSYFEEHLWKVPWEGIAYKPKSENKQSIVNFIKKATPTQAIPVNFAYYF